MDLRGRYGQLSQPPPVQVITEYTQQYVPLPTARKRAASNVSVSPNASLTKSSTPVTIGNDVAESNDNNDKFNAHQKNSKARGVGVKGATPFPIHPITYDPTRPVSDSISHQESSYKFDSFTPTLAAPASILYPNLSDSDSDTYAESNTESLDERKYANMLDQYAEMTGISFSSSFLANFEDTVFGTNASNDSSTRTSQENVGFDDDLPFHKSRLPKAYRPNVVNPRPLMDIADGPAYPIWPPFIKGSVEAPNLPRCAMIDKEAFYPAQQPQMAPDRLLSQTTKSFPMNIPVYESLYSIYPLSLSSATSAASPCAVNDPSQEFYKVPSLFFESRFECGNLAKAIRRGPSHYELHVRNDLNTAGHAQWFFFRVRGMVTRNEYSYEDILYRFDIVNLSKPKTLYSSGLKPLIFSEWVAEEKGVGWHRVGTNIQYYPTPEFQLQADDSDSPLPPVPKYTLSFTFRFPRTDDTVYFAHCFPYSYTDLQNDISTLKADPTRAALFRHTILAKSVAGNNIDLLTITKPCTSPEELNARQGIVLSARVHPGETNASWMMRGVLRHLTGPSEEAAALRERFVIKIVPMINPDGVIIGNYRCNLTGYDLNRQWTGTNNPRATQVIPEICAMYSLLERSVASRPVLLFCDFHGHNRKKGIFMYGCENEAKTKPRAGGGGEVGSGRGKTFGASAAAASSRRKSVTFDKKTARSSFSADTTKRGTSSNNHLVSPDSGPHTPEGSLSSDALKPATAIIPPVRFMERVFPMMLASNAPDLFYFRRCQFKMQSSKRGTGRICVRKQFGIVNSFTIEASFAGSDVSDAAAGGWHYGTRDLERMGEGLAKSLHDYFIVEGKRQAVYKSFVDRVNNHDAVVEPEERQVGLDESETTSDDEVLRIKPPKKKVLTKRASVIVVPRSPKKPIVTEKPRYNNKAVPVTPSSPTSKKIKDSIILTKVKVTSTTPHPEIIKPELRSPIRPQPPPPSSTAPLQSQTPDFIPPNPPHRLREPTIRLHSDLAVSHAVVQSGRLAPSFRIKSLAPSGVYFRPVSAMQLGGGATTVETMPVGWAPDGNHVEVRGPDGEMGSAGRAVLDDGKAVVHMAGLDEKLRASKPKVSAGNVGVITRKASTASKVVEPKKVVAAKRGSTAGTSHPAVVVMPKVYGL
ncbi:hypothetical protein BC830DRAFT_1170401 [Chytriomyces sp. MP71]|nr:hypothetical protein BC830DRAFT_1170401 [Chytriomyces sp. MP71]